MARRGQRSASYLSTIWLGENDSISQVLKRRSGDCLTNGVEGKALPDSCSRRERGGGRFEMGEKLKFNSHWTGISYS